MKNEILDYLKRYYENFENRNQKSIERANSFFKNINKLYDTKVINSDQQDSLIESMCAYGDYILYIISNCPTLEIHLRKVMKNKPYKAKNKRVETNSYISAIGFVVDEDEVETEDDMGIRC